MTLGIIDYGSGNLTSVGNMLGWLGADYERVTTPERLLAMDRLLLPGVGAAREALEFLKARGLDQALEEAVQRHARPLFGICLGMQMLAVRLTEFGDSAGLGWIDGEVVDLDTVLAPGARIPHMGWNEIETSDPMFQALHGRKEFYFAHSFTLRPKDEECVAAWVNFGGSRLVAAVRLRNIFATQFHPEKSQTAGEALLSEFLNWSP